MKRSFFFCFLLGGVCLAHGQGLDTMAVRLGVGSELLNSIIYGNTSSKAVSPEAQTEYSASEHILNGTANQRLNSSPFSGVDYRLASNSSLRDRGNLSAILSSDTLDLDYLRRVMCEQVDMGAYEYPITRTKILTQALASRICQEGDILFNVQAQGDHLSYQWQRNELDIQGAGQAQYRKIGALPTDTGRYRVIVYGACCNDTSVSVRLDVDALPKVLARADTSIISGGNVPLYVISSVGNVVWYDPQGTVVLDFQLRNIQHSMVYKAVATHGVCSAEASDEVLIKVNGDACQVVVAPDTSICSGEALRLSVTHIQGDYKWVIAGTTQELPKNAVVRPEDNTIYVAVASNAGSTCTDTLRVKVRKVSFDVRDNASVCAGNPISLYSTPMAHTWYQVLTNGDLVSIGTANINEVYPPANAITYYVGEYQDKDGCVVQKKVKVYANPIHFVTMPDTNICAGEEVALYTNTESQVVIWKDEKGNSLSDEPIVKPMISTSYYAQTFDDACGTIIDSVHIKVTPMPILSLLSDTLLCMGEVLELWSSPHADYWESELFGRLPHIWVDAKKSDRFVAHLKVEACTLSETMFLEVREKPQLLVMNDTLIEKGNCVVLSSEPAAEAWYPLGASPALSTLRVCPEETMHYRAELSSEFCGSVYDTVRVEVKADTVIPPPPLDTLLRVDIVLMRACVEGGSIARVLVRGGKAPYTYVWSTGSNDSVVRDIAFGELCVEVTDAAEEQAIACIQVDSIHPIHLSRKELLSPSNERCNDGIIFVVARGGMPPYEYLWNNGITDSIMSPAQAGIYQLRVIDINDCEQNFTIELNCQYKRVMPTLFITPNGDGKNDYLAIEYIDLYPNNTVLIINGYGEEVASFQGYNNRDVRWDGKNKKGKVLPDGVYYYIIRAEGMEPMVGHLLMKLSKN